MLVSIIMPAYNAEKWIEEAIRSVMAQTYQHWELLVIDDGSADDTRQIVHRLAAEDGRIHLIVNQENRGVAESRNRGFAGAKGSFIALLDSDDMWHPRKLERQLELAKQSGADIVYCSYGIVDERGRKVCRDFVVPERTDFDRTLVQSVISCSTALLSREIVQRYRFTSRYAHEDLVLWLQLLKDGYTARGVQEVLAWYRLSEDSRSRDKWKSAGNRWKVYRKCFDISVVKSGWLLLRYAIGGVRKYRRTGGELRGRKHK